MQAPFCDDDEIMLRCGFPEKIGLVCFVGIGDDHFGGSTVFSGGRAEGIPQHVGRAVIGSAVLKNERNGKRPGRAFLLGNKGCAAKDGQKEKGERKGAFYAGQKEGNRHGCTLLWW